VGARTAAELVAELERRKREDPAYRAELERVESKHAERTRLLRIAERPVVDDLRAIGLDLDTVWDLYKIPDSRPQAIPVLLKHLALDYPDRVLESIGQGLDDRCARAFWSDLRAMLLNTDRGVVRDRVAAALSGCATREHYDDLLAFIEQCLKPVDRVPGLDVRVGVPSR
jgi:hypothetical protein